MRRLFLALLCCLPAFAGWNYTAALTYNAALTGTVASSNFPALVSATDNSLCLASNGTHAGYVQSSTGADIEFFTTSALTTQIASEIEFYSGSGSTCSVIAWVQVATLSVTANGTIYVAAGNASPPARTTNPYDANYYGIWHWPNGTTLTLNDSTTHGYNGTGSGTPTAAAGEVDGALGLNGSSQYVSVGTLGSFGSSRGSGVTISTWVYSTQNTAIAAVYGDADVSGSTNTTSLKINTNSSNSLAAGNLRFAFVDGGGASDLLLGGVNSNVITLNTWHYVVVEFTVPNIVSVYVDGQPQTVVYNTQDSLTDWINYASNWYWGAMDTAGTASLWTAGRLDESRIGITDRSASWVLAEYNNQSAPGNIGSPGFWTWGSWIVPPPTLSESGCSTATLGSASASCTITASGGSFNGTTNTVSLTDSATVGVGGLFTFTGASPASFTGSGTVTPSAGTSFSFTYTPAIVGPRTIAVTNNFTAVNPSAWTIAVTSGSPCAFTMTGSGTQSIAATSGWTSTGGCGHSSPTSGDSLAATASGGTLTITVPNDGNVHSLGTCPAANTTYDLQLTAVAAGSAIFDVQPGAKLYFCGNKQLTSVVTAAGSTPTVWADLKYETGATVYEDEGQASYAHRTVSGATNEWVRLLWGSSGDTCAFGPGAAYSCPTNVQAVNVGTVNPVAYDANGLLDTSIYKIYGTGITGGCGSATAGCLTNATAGTLSTDTYADANAIYLGGDVFDTTGTVQSTRYGFDNTVRLQVAGTHFVNDLLGFGYNGGNNAWDVPYYMKSCVLTGNYFSADVGNNNQSFSSCSISGNVFAGGFNFAYVGALPPVTAFSGNAVAVDNANGYTINVTMSAPVVNNYFMYVDNVSSNHLFMTQALNDYYRGNVFEGLYAGLYESHCAGAGSTVSTTNTVIEIDNLSVMSPDGNNTCQLYGWGESGNPTMVVGWIDHNGAFGQGTYSWFAQFGHQTGMYMANQALRSFRSNLGWAPSTGVYNFAVAPNADTGATAPNNNVYVPNESYNAWWNPTASTLFSTTLANPNCNPSTSEGTPYTQCTGSGTPGAHDITANPKVVNMARGLFNWASTMRGQTATLAGAYAAFQGCQSLPYCIAQLEWWVRQGYQPTNLALKGAAHDGAVVGVTGTLGSGYSGSCSATVTVQDTDDLGTGAALTCSFVGGAPSIAVANPGIHYRVATPATVAITGTSGSGTSLHVVVSPGDIGPVPIALFAGVAP